MAEKEHISNLVWIVAIALLLTFLIVVISWMSSGKLKVEKAEEKAKTSEIMAESKTFIPETKFAGEEKEPLKKESTPPVEETIVKEPLGQEKKEENAKAVSESAAVEPQPVIVSQKEENSDKPKKPDQEKKVESPKGSFSLQVGAFSSLENAKSFEKKLSSRGYKTATRQKGNLTVVLIVDVPSEEEAFKLKEKLAKENIQSSIISNK